MTKVLHVGYTHNPGGIESYIINNYRLIDRQKVHFSFLNQSSAALAYEDQLLTLGAQILSMNQKRTFRNYVRYIIDLIKTLRSAKCDVIEFHLMSYSPFEQVLLASFFTKARIIIHAHSSNRAMNEGLKTKLLDFLGVSLIRLFARESIQIACGEQAGKVFFGNSDYLVVNNGIDIRQYEYSEVDRLRIRSELGITKDACVLIGVARFNRIKNHSFMIDVFRDFLRHNPDSILLLVGDGVLRHTIENKVLSMGITDSVIFLGARSDVPQLYSVADIFLMTSLYEGLGMVVIEAQANGLCSLVSSGVPSEVDITGNVRFLNLELGARYWSRELSGLVLKRDNNAPAQLQRAGYDITETSKQIQDIYCGKDL